MIVLVTGLVIFFTVHSISIVNEPWRNRFANKLGEGPFKGLYSLFAALGLGLMIWGYGLARYEPVVVYIPPFWLRHLAMFLLLPVFPLLLAVYFPGKIKAITKHPMLVSVKLWALAHLLVNGMLADILLFGSFLVWAIADRISVKRRAPKEIPVMPTGMLNDIIAITGGLGLYVVFVFWLHYWMTGMPLATI